MNTVFSFFRTIVRRMKEPRLIGLFLILGIILLIGVGCGGKAKPSPTVKPTKAPLPTPTLAPTLAPTLTPTEIVGLKNIVDSGAPLAPQVVAQEPVGGQEIPVEGGAIEITFDQAMDPTTTNTAWRFVDLEGNSVPGEISWLTTQRMRFTPAKSLVSGSTYLAKLDTSALSALGVALREQLTFEFNTVGELQVNQVFPANGSTDVESTSTITVIFNRPIVPLVIAEEQGNLPTPITIDPPVAGKGEWVNTSVYAFRPEGYLSGGITYHVSINAGLADATGMTSLVESYTWEFSTAAPSIESYWLTGREWETNPADYYFNVLLDTGFAISFHQAMDHSRVEAAFSLASNNLETVPVDFLWNNKDTQVVITPTVRLALNTSYTLHLGTEAQSVDGGTLLEGLDWHFTTVMPPAIQFTDPYDGSTQGEYSSQLSIYFASPMKYSTLIDKVVITPAPKVEFEWYYDENWYYSSWRIYAFCLEPSTRYQVRVLPGMEDLYGNQITQEYNFSFTTGPFQPYAYLQMPYVPALYRVGGPQEFYAAYGNVDKVQLGLYKLTPQDFMSFLSYNKSIWDYVPAAQDKVWSLNVTNTAGLNQRVLKSIQPTTNDGTPLPTGFYFLTLNSPQVRTSGPYADTRLVIVATDNLTFKYTNTEALLWLTDLTTGKPIQGVALTIYDNQFKVMGSGVTDENGMLYVPIAMQKDYYSGLYAITDPGQDHFAVTSSDWGSGVSAYDFGISNEYYAQTNQPRAYVYSDRPIYRPGQPVYFKGIVRVDDDLSYSLPSNSTVYVTIQGYDEVVYQETLPLDEFGSFNGELLLDKEAAVGYYYISVQFNPDQDSIGSLSFNVAEYRKPEFQVGVVSDKTDVLDGDTFNVTVSADYYSGGGLADADVYWYLTAQEFTFSPPDPQGRYSGYSFSAVDRDSGYTYWCWDCYTPVEFVADGNAQTDGNGKLVLTLPADLSKYGTGMVFTLETTVTDLSGSSVSGRVTVTAHRSGVYPGVKPATYVGVQGKEQSFEIVAVDWYGNPQAGQTVNVEIVERKWNSVMEQDENGNVRWNSTVEEIPVTSLNNVQLDDKGHASVSFVPPNGGVFMARVTAVDSTGHEGISSAYMWVAGEDYVPWRQENNRSFELVLNQDNYQPGDTAEILIASPFQGQNYALITIERGHIRYREVVLLTSNSTVYKLPITPDMAPNVYISVLIIKGVDDTSPRPDFRMGMAQINVDTRQQELVVTIIPDRQQAGPGDTVNYTVRTTDKDGNPVSAEVSLGLSDLATLSLMDPNAPKILDYFYSQRGLSVWTSVAIVNSIEFYNAELAAQEAARAEGVGAGAGGGKGEGDFGVIEVRQDFPDTAYWNATLQTGSTGEATVSVTLPDNLTTWRMDARAVTEDTRVGQATQDIQSTKPLLIRPQTPRFFVVGDQAQLGALLQNNTDQDLTVEVSLTATGIDLQSDATQTVNITARRTAYVTWNVTAQMDATRVDIVFIAQGGGYSDATRPTLGTLDNQGIPVYSFDAPETVGTSGLIDQADTVIESINLPSAFTASAGTLTIKVSPSLAAGITDGLTYLEHYPYECVEQTISRFLPNVLTMRALQTAGINDAELAANLSEQVSTALQRLYNWQNADGGWGWWYTDESDPLTSSYVMLGLTVAHQAGYTVQTDVIDRGIAYLRSQLRTVKSLEQPYLLNRQAFILYVLARAGESDVSRTVALYDQRQNMALYARAFLAHTLYMIDTGDPRIATLLSDINNAAILSATGTHWEEDVADSYNWNTDTRTTAIVLSVVSQIDPQNLLNANAVRWLMSNRTDGHWAGTQETAWTLMALTHWMEASGELQADYQYAIGLNGERIGGGVANAETLRTTLELQVDISELMKDQANRLAFARDEGPGNLYYTAHLNVTLPVEQIQALNRGIIVSRSYYRLDDHAQSVTEAQQGDLLIAQITIVAPHALHYIVVNDPLPAGLEAVDQSLNISQQSVKVDADTGPGTYTWQDLLYRGWGWWYFRHTEIHDERVIISTDYLPAGTYTFNYLVRASTPGTFRVIPTVAQEFYFPEVYGRGDGSLFVIKP